MKKKQNKTKQECITCLSMKYEDVRKRNQNFSLKKNVHLFELRTL